MKAPSLRSLWLAFAVSSCAPPPLPPPADAGLACPANSEPTERGTCQCLRGHVPNLTGTACVLDDRNDEDGGPPPPDAGPGDAGDCAPTPYADTDSRAYFDERLRAATFSCSSCHRSVAPVFDEAGGYEVIRARVEDTAASAEATTAGQIYRVGGSTLPGHDYPFTEAAAAEVWLDRHLFGVQPPGCP